MQATNIQLDLSLAYGLILFLINQICVQHIKQTEKEERKRNCLALARLK